MLKILLLRQVHAGRKYVTPALAEELAASLSEGSAFATHEALSNREYEVFRRFGAGVRVNEIAHELALSPKTVRTYRSRILEKMSIRSTAELIFYAVQNGLVGQAHRLVRRLRELAHHARDAQAQV